VCGRRKQIGLQRNTSVLSRACGISSAKTSCADFADNGVDAIKALREKSPEKYSEIAARLIAAIESKPDGFGNCTTMEQIGRKLLQSVGADDVELTGDMIAEAVAANDKFIAKLEEIRNNALMAGAIQGEGELN
jgi:hypothetical protein